MHKTKNGITIYLYYILKICQAKIYNVLEPEYMFFFFKHEERRQDEHAKSFVNSTAGLKNSRLSIFCLCHLHTHSLYTVYDNKLYYKPDRNSFPAFFIFHSCYLIIFLECFNTITVTNLLHDHGRQTDPAGQLTNNLKLHLKNIQE